MARIKTGNKLNVVFGTKSQIDSDITIPNNSIIIKTDDNEYDYYTKAEINSMIGDIETALDAILGVWYYVN